jgi:hypothetical protein
MLAATVPVPAHVIEDARAISGLRAELIEGGSRN